MYESSPIIPISAQHRANLDILLETIEKKIPTPKRDLKKNPLMVVARSFDVNKPGTSPEKLLGGVLGGCLKQGKLKTSQEIEIKPGIKIEEKNQVIWKPITTKIEEIISGGVKIKEVVPGGSIGLLTLLDPSIVKSDAFTGSIIGLPGKLPEVWHNLNLEIHLLERVVGTKEELEVEPIKMNEALMLNVNSAATLGVVTEVLKEKIKCSLKLPVCAENKARVTISRRIGNRFRLIGYGIIC